MINSLFASTPTRGEPPDASRHRPQWRRLGLLLALASALALAIAVMAAPQPAQAVTSIDGQWTVSHGGTGQLTLNSNGTYTSSCQVYPNYADAWCPAASGTFQYSTAGTAGVTFNGADGTTTSYRVSGLVSSPDTITSVFGSTTSSALVMTKGPNFVCTDWGTNGYMMKGSPLVYLDSTGTTLYATGSHQLIGPATADTQVSLAETAPNYFQVGSCANFAPVIHIDSLRDTSVTSSPGMWAPKVTVVLKDATGAFVSGAKVTGQFPDADIVNRLTSCVTAADGTCTLGNFELANSMTSTSFTAYLVEKTGSVWDQSQATLTLNYPTITTPTPTPTPSPTPVVIHVGDLDNSTTAASSIRKWQPKVTATVVNSAGAAVAGAAVSGTFTNHKGTLICTTAANGTCTLGNFSLTRSTTKTVFTVTNVVKASSTYAPKANSDPDGDSNGTTITIARP
ncbi:hypothetical protein [Arthrobacter sp.]|uniref:hypothetical protein n=1 Tax=Arthrobacter sp. TaxID=1667 RepID=UPI0026DF7FB8|nr:hypothetical protein [Arthrobacter sp.]MDO5753758.1 hypothetical protein [Arthrobacter sp.]